MSPEVHRRPAVRRASTRPTATCSTRPGPARPRAWWRWPTTRRPAGAARAALGGAGRGQPAGSVLLRPRLSASTGAGHLCAVALALAAAGRLGPTPVGPASAWLKWPNDLLARRTGSWRGSWPRSDLARRRRPARGPAAVVVGIGINVKWPAANAGLAPAAAGTDRLDAWRDGAGDREALLGASSLRRGSGGRAGPPRLAARRLADATWCGAGSTAGPRVAGGTSTTGRFVGPRRGDHEPRATSSWRPGPRGDRVRRRRPPPASGS